MGIPMGWLCLWEAFHLIFVCRLKWGFLVGSFYAENMAIETLNGIIYNETVGRAPANS